MKPSEALRNELQKNHSIIAREKTEDLCLISYILCLANE